ncbi:helix-turn-helix domain-containing protein [Hypericibacter sp.]|uniref:helix-turn-helix domain-containing protein n=1 Tax=Hypericibacter sp. TaxID=2705401 RepID=UPI003D6D9D49
MSDRGADRTGSRVGALLRTAREATGRNLQSVSQQLRIRAVYLRAIEEGDFGSLPGTTYAVGFVRSYADFLGLDGPDIVRRFREEVEELGRRTQLVFPVTPAEGKIPGGAIVLMAIVIVGVCYGTWFYMSDRERSLAGLIPEVPTELKNLLGSGAPPPAETPATSVSTANPTIQTPAPVEPAAPAATDSSNAAPVPAATGNGETTAGVATTSDEQAAAAIAMAPDNSSPAGADEDEVPPAPDDADAATDTPAEGQAGTEGAQGTDDQEIVEAPSLDTSPTETPTITTPSIATTTAPSATGLSNAAAAAAATTTPPASTTAPTTTQQASTSTAPPAPPPAPAVSEDSLPKGQDYGVTNGQSRVILVARQEAWVQVSSATQEVWTRVLRTGDRYLVPNDPTLTLSTGNAGGLDIMVDGKKVPSLGPVGVVRRGISLDPNRLLGGSAIP